MGRNQKRNKKVKIEMGSRNSVAGFRSEQCIGGMNSGKQDANFATCGIFAILQNSCIALFSCIFCSSFLQVFYL